MTTHELLEYAVLDAHGMLDDDERRAFELSFASSSSAVQNQIRREQARLVDLTGLLPEVDPAPELRARVIDAIRAEIHHAARQNEAFAEGPGGGSNDRGRRVTHAASQITGVRGGRLGLRRRVSSLWRAGALGLSAACLLLVVMLVRLQGDYSSMNVAIINDTLVDEAVRTYSRDFMLDTLFDSQTQRIVFATENGEPRGEVALFVNSDWNESVLYQRFGDDAGKKFQVAIVDEAGAVVEVVHEFTAISGLDAIRVPSLAQTDLSRVRIIERVAPGLPAGLVLGPVSA